METDRANMRRQPAWWSGLFCRGEVASRRRCLGYDDSQQTVVRRRTGVPDNKTTLYDILLNHNLKFQIKSSQIY